jgi:hypothetical protein
MGADVSSDAVAPPVQLLLPAWTALNLDPRTRAVCIARLVEEHNGGRAEFRPENQRMKATLEGAIDSAVARGASLGYLLLVGETGKVATASLFVALPDGYRRVRQRQGSQRGRREDSGMVRRP